jgi:hypothetical protein
MLTAVKKLNKIYAYSSGKVNITIRKKKHCNIRVDDN